MNLADDHRRSVCLITDPEQESWSNASDQLLLFGTSTIITRDALRGHTVSKNGSISFYAGCPEGAYRV